MIDAALLALLPFSLQATPNLEVPLAIEAKQPLGEVPLPLELSPAKKFKASDRLPLHLRWSKDGTVAAYVGYRGEEGAEKVPVIHRAGEKAPIVGDAYDFIDGPTIAKEAPRVAFRVGNTKTKRTERWWVWLDGKPEHQEDWIGAVALSPDGERVAYWAQPDAELGPGGGYVPNPLILRAPGKKKVRKPKKWNEARALEAPVFSADSKKVFGLATDGSEWFAVGRGRKGFEALTDGHRFVSDLQVAKDGKVLAFSALVQQLQGGSLQQSQRVVVGDEIIPSSRVRTGFVSLSPDGKRTAQKFMSFGMTMGISIDGGSGKEPGFDYVGRAAWDAKGSRVAFASVTNAGGVERDALTHKGELEPREGEWRLTQMTRKGKSATGKRSWERLRTPSYSGDGEMVVARVLDAKGWHVVVFDLDGVVLAEGPAHTEVGIPHWSDDAESVSYGIRDERTLSWATLRWEE